MSQILQTTEAPHDERVLRCNDVVVWIHELEGTRNYPPLSTTEMIFCVFTDAKYFFRSEFFSGQRADDFLVVENFLTELMKIQRFLKSFIVCASMLCATNAFSQASKVTSDKPTFDDLPSPEFPGGNKQKAFKPKDWLEVETKFKVELSPEPKSKTAEEVIVKWYVAVKNPDKSGYFFKLSKTVTHINVPLNEDVYSSIYLSPASVTRLTGSPRNGKNAVEFVGYEIIVNGEVKATETSKGPAKWWTLPSEKISDNDSVPLLTKSETPFAAMWWDRYADEKKEK